MKTKGEVLRSGLTYTTRLAGLGGVARRELIVDLSCCTYSDTGGRVVEVPVK